MSKVVSPYPPYTGSIDPPPNAQWWRIARLPENENHHYALESYDSDQGWLSLEFFDGYDTIIDTGFDKPTKVRFHSDNGVGLLDVLHVGPPTPSELWKPLTKPGIFQHPDDVSVGCPGKDTA